MRIAGPHRWATLTVQLAFIMVTIFAIKDSQWFMAAIALIVLLITFFPVLLERLLGIRTPPQLYFLVVGFVVASLFFGEGLGYYARFWWWDILLHVVAGLLLGIVGFLMIYGRYCEIHASNLVTRSLITSFSFFFSLSFGVIWEIFEFTVDRLLGTNMQMSLSGGLAGLKDTMWDLIMNTVGALIVALLGWRYLKNMGTSIIFNNFIDAFVGVNPQLFTTERQSNLS